MLKAGVANVYNAEKHAKAVRERKLIKFPLFRAGSKEIIYIRRIAILFSVLCLFVGSLFGISNDIHNKNSQALSKLRYTIAQPPYSDAPSNKNPHGQDPGDKKPPKEGNPPSDPTREPIPITPLPLVNPALIHIGY